jgi:hypothetical protein
MTAQREPLKPFPKAEVRKLCDEAREEIRKVLERPFVDPGAPEGYLRPEFRDVEIGKRLAAIRRIQDRLARRIGKLCGPAAEASVREMQRLTLETAEAVIAGKVH